MPMYTKATSVVSALINHLRLVMVDVFVFILVDEILTAFLDEWILYHYQYRVISGCRFTPRHILSAFINDREL